jgi:hypothetical protein
MKDNQNNNKNSNTNNNKINYNKINYNKKGSHNRVYSTAEARTKH